MIVLSGRWLADYTVGALLVPAADTLVGGFVLSVTLATYPRGSLGEADESFEHCFLLDCGFCS